MSWVSDNWAFISSPAIAFTSSTINFRFRLVRTVPRSADASTGAYKRKKKSLNDLILVLFLLIWQDKCELCRKIRSIIESKFTRAINHLPFPLGSYNSAKLNRKFTIDFYSSKYCMTYCSCCNLTSNLLYLNLAPKRLLQNLFNPTVSKFSC